jgi:hypothetical protein
MARLRNTAVLAIAVVVAAMAVSACGSSSEETTGGGDSAPTAPANPSQPPASSSSAPGGVEATACGSVGSATRVRATGVACARARKLASAWSAAENCTIPKGASRGSCRVSGTVCLSTVSGRGIAVSCAKPDQSVAFIARRR